MGTATCATLLFAVASLLLLDDSAAVQPRRCRRLARRQRQLTARDDFPETNCGTQATRDLKLAIGERCDAGLCAGIGRKACKKTIRAELVVEIFPQECEDVPACVPEECSADTCRQSANLSLTYPLNCPQLCILVGFCATATCTAQIPACSSGQAIDQATCSCITVTTPAPTPAPITPAPTPSECTGDPDCPNDGPCRVGTCVDGTCSLVDSSTCCTNDQTSSNIDLECNEGEPICGLAGGGLIPAGSSGNQCFVCQNSATGEGTDEGCEDTSRFCASIGGSSVGDGGLGTACFLCQTSGATPNLGCPATSPVCAFSAAGFVGPAGNFGNACFTCANDSDGVDTGCTPDAPSCTAPVNTAGSECTACENNLPGESTDMGCTASAPFCASVDGDIGNGELGVCLSCLAGTVPGLGCPVEAPVCAEGSCVVCSKFGYGDDVGCPASTPICGLLSGTTLAENGDVGEQCFVCENTGADLDPGCDVGVCATALGTLGASCSLCKNDQTSATTPDLGCDDAAPQCVSTTGILEINGFGNACQ